MSGWYIFTLENIDKTIHYWTRDRKHGDPLFLSGVDETPDGKLSHDNPIDCN